jgi:hypothetical protein
MMCAHVVLRRAVAALEQPLGDPLERLKAFESAGGWEIPNEILLTTATR